MSEDNPYPNCPTCGRPVPGDAKFCPHCGAKQTPHRDHEEPAREPTGLMQVAPPGDPVTARAAYKSLARKYQSGQASKAAPPLKASLGEGAPLKAALAAGLIAVTTTQGIQVFDLGTKTRIGSLVTPACPVALALRPDGRDLAFSLGMGELCIWQPRSSEAPAVLGALEAKTGCMAFSPDGQSLASGSEDGTIIIWDIETWAMLHILRGHNSRIRGLVFAHDGQLLVSWDFGKSGDTLRALVWDIASARIVRPLPEHDHQSIMNMCFSPDCTRIASTGDLFCYISDIASGKLLARSVVPWDEAPTWATEWFRVQRPLELARGLPGLSRPIKDIAFSPDGTILAAAQDDCSVRVWDLASQHLVLTIGAAAERPGLVNCSSLAFAPSGDILACATTDGFVHEWRIPDGTLLHRFQAHQPGRSLLCSGPHVRFSPDGSLLATAGMDGRLAVRLAPAGPVVWTAQADEKQQVNSIAFSHGGEVLASGGADGSTRLWDPKTGKALRSIVPRRDGYLLLPGPRPVTWIGFSGHTNALLADSSNLYAFGTQTEEQSEIRYGGITSPFSYRHEDVSPTEPVWGYGTLDGDVHVWDLLPPKERLAFHGHAASVDAVAFSCDGSRIATSGEDGIVKVWAISEHQTHHAKT